MRHLTWQPTTDPDVRLTGYLHDPSEKYANLAARPAVLVFPGGGYEICSDREAEPVALAFAGAGYHSFVLRYPVGAASQWPAPMQAAEGALRLISDQAAELGVDIQRIAVAGFSAGGHLAAALSVLGSVRPAATLLIYTVTTGQTLRLCNRGVHPAPDLLAALDSTCPATFLAHTASDELVPVTDSLRYAQRLAECQIPFELHVFPSGAHGMSLADWSTSGGVPDKQSAVFAGWRPLAIAWLGRTFSLC